MSTKPQELKKIIDNLRQIIVGKVAMPPDQIEQITLFLFLKQLSKKHDDLVRAKSKELIFTGPYERYHFDVLMRHSGEELVKECREAVESLYKNPHIDPTVRRVFERSYLKILEPKVLSAFLQYLDEVFSDGFDLGDFYESLLPILGTQNELGQFRTPRHIIDFIVRVVNPNIGEKIADPACGTAGFLVAAFNYLKEKYTDDKGRLTLNPEQTKKLYNETIFGWDMEPLMVKFSLANLYLHGLKIPNVTENDTLLNENLWQYTFDVIIANPPFITPRGGARRHSRFAVTSNKTEVLFCEWMVYHLNFNGRLGMIVPEGIIFDRSRGHQAIRKLFLDSGLWCVVSLPAAVFQPYSGVKTSIVFVDKQLKPQEILFVNIKNHGFSLNTNPAPIEANDLPAALEIIKKYKIALKENKPFELNDDAKQLAHLVAKEKIEASGDYNLSGDRYKETDQFTNQKWPMVALEELTKVFIDGNWIESKDQSESGIRLIQTGNIGLGEYLDKSGKARFISEETFKRLNCTEVFANDILVSRLPDPVGRVCMLPKLDTRMITAVDCTIIRFDEEKIIPKYFLFFSKSERYFNALAQYLTGSSRQRISRSNLAKIKIPLPPIEAQKEIVKQIEVLEDEKTYLNKEEKAISRRQSNIIKVALFEQEQESLDSKAEANLVSSFNSLLDSIELILEESKHRHMLIENFILNLRELSYFFEKLFYDQLDSNQKQTIINIVRARNAICHRTSFQNNYSDNLIIQCGLIINNNDIEIQYGKTKVLFKEIITLYKKFREIVSQDARLKWISKNPNWQIDEQRLNQILSNYELIMKKVVRGVVKSD